MTNERAIEILKRKTTIPGDGFTFDEIEEAIQMAICALSIARDTNVPSNGEPLTLEQLREMHGEPVWIERNEYPHDGKWFIVDYADTKNPDRTLYTNNGCTYSDYGKYFMAYPYPPARIGREKWEACELCRRKGEQDPCYENQCFRKNAHQCNYRCDRFLKWRDIERKLHNAKFCPRCGRPLKPEAWEELEKRFMSECPISKSLENCEDCGFCELEDTMSEWISVNDALPELREDGTFDCFLVSDGFLVHMAYYAKDGWKFCESGEMKEPMFYTVTHWMPLPEPPKEG